MPSMIIGFGVMIEVVLIP